MSSIEPISDDSDTYELYAVSVETVHRHMCRSRLYEDYSEHNMIAYRPLTKVNDSEWLIDVDSRVYAVPEDMLEEGMDEVNNRLNRTEG